MQTVGKFDDDNSQILCHSNENLSEVFRLRLFSVDKLKFVEFGYALDKFANLVAELLSKFVVSDGRIFQNVMQNAAMTVDESKPKSARISTTAQG